MKRPFGESSLWEREGVGKRSGNRYEKGVGVRHGKRCGSEEKERIGMREERRCVREMRMIEWERKDLGENAGRLSFE